MNPSKQNILFYTFDNQLYYVTFTDLYSRWTEIEKIYNITAPITCKFFQNCWLSKFTSPTKVITDNDKQYISSIFKQFCADCNTNHISTSSYNHTANSVSERKNQGISLILSTNKGTHIYTLASKISNKLNMAANRSLKQSPFEILNHRSKLDPIQRDIKADISAREEIMKNVMIKSEEFQTIKKNYTYAN